MKQHPVFGTILIICLCAFGATAAHAGLANDQIRCYVSGTNDPILPCDTTLAVVSAGAEFALVYFGENLFEIDVSDTHFRMSLLGDRDVPLSLPLTLTLADLRWITPSGELIRIDDLEVQNFSTEGISSDRYSANQSGVTIEAVSLGRDRLDFFLGYTDWTPGAFVEWDFVVKQEAYVGAASLSNLGAGYADAVAALRTTRAGIPQVVVKDAGTNELINAVPFFWSAWTPIAVAGIDADNDGIDDVAVLAVDRAADKVKVQVRDALTGVLITEMAFLPRGWSPIDLIAVDGNGDGIKDLGVLAVSDEDGSVMTVIKDVVTRQRLTTVDFHAGG